MYTKTSYNAYLQLTFYDVLCQFVNFITFPIICIQKRHKTYIYNDVLWRFVWIREYYNFPNHLYTKTSYNVYLQLTFCDVLCQFVNITTILIMFIQKRHKTFIYNRRFKMICDIIAFLILSIEKRHKTFIYNCILWRFVIMSEYYNVSNHVRKNIINRLLN